MAIKRKEVVVDVVHNQIRNLVARHFDGAISKKGYLHMNADALFSEARALTGSVDEAGRVMKILRELTPDHLTFEVFSEGVYDGNNIVIYRRGDRPDYQKPKLNKLTNGQMARLALGLLYQYPVKPNTLFCQYKVTRANIASAQAIADRVKKTGYTFSASAINHAWIPVISDAGAQEIIAIYLRSVDHLEKLSISMPKKAKVKARAIYVEGHYTAKQLKSLLDSM
jgi:hypothetical protein